MCLAGFGPAGNLGSDLYIFSFNIIIPNIWETNGNMGENSFKMTGWDNVINVVQVC